MAEYNPSKIIKDGNTYNFRDTTKIPLAGTYNIMGVYFFKNVDTSYITISGGHAWNTSAYLTLCGGVNSENPGAFIFHACKTDGNFYRLIGYPNGTLTWGGQPIQYSSDRRLKQQITQIDNALLDAWEDVNLVQFKYNDAVSEKKDTARLHTGYVVQQIDEACKSHGVDISEYGLYCHEVYQEETREVEHEDGTKTTEVVRPASEHYSLRYTEALIVECAYLRKCIKELRNEIEELKSSK